MSNDLHGEIVLASGSEEARLPDIPRDVLRALHSAVLGKKEQFSQNYHRCSIVDANDLEQLCLILGQWSSQYNPTSRKITITATHVNGVNKQKKYRYKFGSLDSFKKYDLSTKDPITSIIFSFSMVSIHPETGDYQPLDLNLDFTGLYNHPYYYLKNGMHSRYRLDPDEVSCKVQIEFVDHIVSKSLQTAVEEWYYGLKTVEEPRPNKWLNLFAYDYSDTFPDGKFVSSWLAVVISVFISFGLVSNYRLPGLVDDTIWFLSLCVFIATILHGLHRWAISRAIGVIYYDFLIPLIRVNRGNEDQVERFLSEKVKALKARQFWVGTILTGFVVSVVAGVVVNFFPV
ncbi:hypothetical protein PHIN109289_12325 [Phaeobacter inhibens]|uniref:hypothetical protein n=1 Tax=Phaeobacter inhibens TaxID=221822 RepID=UPI000486B3E2|nr:hypothetical protein [Phaeobacter inhibens]